MHKMKQFPLAHCPTVLIEVLRNSTQNSCSEQPVSLVNFNPYILLTWRIWGAPNNASRWQMGFNSASIELKPGRLK